MSDFKFPETSEDLMQMLIDLVERDKIEPTGFGPVVIGARLIDQFCTKKADPLQQLSEWAATGRRSLQIDVGSGVVGRKDRYSCWLYDGETDAEVMVRGTDPKTLSEVVAEALAEILSRTEAL